MPAPHREPPPIAHPWRRRAFISAVAMGAGGLAIGYALRPTAGPQAGGAAAAPFVPNVFVRIAADGLVTIVAKQTDMGQGVKTSLPMILAEELSADWQRVVVEQADVHAAYGDQGTGNSQSIAANYEAYRLLGATARTMLVSAAAQAWGVDASACEALLGRVLHRASGRSAGYGELAPQAAAQPVPAARKVQLKDPARYTLVGSRVSGVDAPAMARGAVVYGIDVQRPGMLHAAYVKSPVFGARVMQANIDAVKAMPGVRAVLVLEGAGDLRGLSPGVAIVADSTWAVMRARRVLQVQWDTGTATARPGVAELMAQAERAVTAGDGQVLRDDGDVEAALAGAHRRLEATYRTPFLAHAALEPLSCTVLASAAGLEIWAATQSPEGASRMLVELLGVDKARITLHLLRAGGSFGRRLGSDFIVEAAAIALRLPESVPVKLTWSREDELQHDHYRPAALHRLRAGISTQGTVIAWSDHYATFGQAGRPGGGAELAGNEFPARWVPNRRLSQSVIDAPVPLGLWRAPGSHTHAWAVQSFIDELALAAGRDPLAFRLTLLGDEDSVRGGGLLSRAPPYRVDRMRAVLQAVAARGGWGKALPRGQGQGLAFHHCHGGYVAQLVEVTVSPAGQVKVDRVVCVCDVGSPIVNLSGAEAQVQGAIVDGLSAAMWQQIDLREGRVMQSNFDTYRLLRMGEEPAVIEVHFILSANSPTGLGEPPLPPVAPALCNAIFRACGHRVRQLPLGLVDLG